MRAVRDVAVHRDPDDETERVTSLATGEEVLVAEVHGEWSRVLAPDQPTHLDPAGYPGWVRSAGLTDDLKAALAARGLPAIAVEAMPPRWH